MRPDSHKDILPLREKADGVSWRAILIGLLLIPINTYWIAMTEMIWSSLHFTAASLPGAQSVVSFAAALSYGGDETTFIICYHEGRT